MKKFPLTKLVLCLAGGGGGTILFRSNGIGSANSNKNANMGNVSSN